MSILCKFRQNRPFNRDFFEPLVIFCCNLTAWAQKWQRQSTETPASTEICDKTTFLGQFSYKTSKFGPNSSNLDPLTEFFWNPCSFFVVIYQPEHKNDKDNQQKHRKYRNLRQNNVFGSIFIQNVQIWAKFHEFGPFDRVLLKPLLIFCCILSGWAQKWQRQSTQTLASIEIQSKTTFWAQFPYKTSKFEPNVAKFDCFSEFSLNLWSFFVVSYQAEQENAQGLQDIHW